MKKQQQIIGKTFKMEKAYIPSDAQHASSYTGHNRICRQFFLVLLFLSKVFFFVTTQ